MHKFLPSPLHTTVQRAAEALRACPAFTPPSSPCDLQTAAAGTAQT